ncbi:ABC transporter [Ceratobasidium sp. AG-Ba]|nr:ABC transporter [Ceratobasidium sp. AG-Ba]
MELVEKRRLLKTEYQDYPKESSSSVVSRLTFFWLVPLLWKGRTSKLDLEDVAAIPPACKAVQARASLETALGNKKNLRSASLITFSGSVLSPLLARLVLVFATFSQPLLVEAMLKYIQNPSATAQEGWALVGGFVCVYGILTVATAVFSFVVQYRGALVGILLQKSLRLASFESRLIGSAKAGTIMSVDVGQVTDGIERFYDVFGSIFSITQWAAFMPIIVIAITMSATSYCGKIIGGRYSAWMDAADKRIKLTASVISNLVPIKLSAYEIPLLKQLERLRSEELDRASKFFSILVINITVSNASSILSAVTVLGSYAIMVHRDPSIGRFDVATVFTILATVQLLTMPLATIGQVLPSLFSSYAALKRIESFLVLEDKPDQGPTELGDTDQYQLRLSSVSASWDRTSDAVLKNVNLVLSKGTTYICIGSVGSGKTSLLTTMLGETVITEGNLFRSPSLSNIAYVAQDAFIMPGTIHDNIVFGRPFDPTRYADVIRVCALEADFMRLHEGDMTRVGDKSGNLSGGQKQRVALARAVYSDAAAMFLDDPLSALGAETEAHVSNWLFGPDGLLKGKTVFMVTHNARHLRFADVIIAMEHGAIKTEGNLDHIRASGYDITEATHEPSSIAPTKPANDEAKKSYRERGLHPYTFWTGMAGVHRVVLSLGLIAVSATISMSMNVYAKFWADDREHLTIWILGYLGLPLTYFALTVLGFASWFKGATIAASTSIHSRALQSLLGSSASYIRNTPSSLLINRLSQDVSIIGFGFPMSIFGAFSASVLTAGSVVLVSVAVWVTDSLLGKQSDQLRQTPWLAISLPFLGIGYWHLIRFYLATSTQLQQLESASKSPLFSSFQTIITGSETIRAFGSQPLFSQQGDVYLNTSQGPLYFRNGGVRLLLLSGLLTSWVNLENGAVAVERISEITDINPEHDSTLLQAPANWSHKPRIKFDQLSLKYSSDLPLALEGLSFEVQAGLRVGICGRTGSGKSSLINALFRFVDPELVHGEISINGTSITNIPLHTLRSSMSIVPQDPFLWHSTIRQNLDVNEAFTEDQIWQSLERVGMKDAVNALEDKLDTILQDSVALSRGQRQLLCIARALLQKRQIVVLDEASSSMDRETDEKIQKVMREDLRNCTVLAVAHRIATVIDFDMVLVLDDGKLVESGEPRVLLSKSSNQFAKLANSQGLYA